MKKYIVLLFLGITLTLNAQYIALPVPIVIQEQSKWCGAAASLSVLRYHFYWGPLQCNIMEYARSINPGMSGFTNCCVNPTPSDCNNKGLDFFGGEGSGSVGDVLERFGPVLTSEIPFPRYFLQIKNDLEMRRPMLVKWEDFFGTIAHAVVIYGIKNDSVLYMDPSNVEEEGGYKRMQYDEFKDDGKVGNKYNYKHRFVVRDKKVNHKSSNDDSEETEYFAPPKFSNPAYQKKQDEISTPTLSILPNPNPGSFQLETNFSLSNIANFKITNMIGATIYETQNLTSHIIQLPTAAAGMHFVVAILKDGRVLTEKMMIQR
jgi:hypothetical protein